MCHFKFADDHVSQFDTSFVDFKVDEVLGDRMVLQSASNCFELLNTDNSILESLHCNVDIEVVHLAFNPTQVLLLAIHLNEHILDV